MAIQPVAERNWWKIPMDREEAVWVTIALVWGVIMFLMMPYWHVYGQQNLAHTAVRMTPAEYMKRAEQMVAQYKVREETAQNIPVVAPPPGSDVYLVARLWSWWPILELEMGKEYRLHLMSMDWLHGFSLQPENVNIQVHPGYDHTVTITPNKKGTYAIVCNEYCGVNHHAMIGRIYVK
jgi:cytochrome c oxidase subunit 2